MKKKSRIILTLVVIVMSLSLIAQEKLLTVEDAIYMNRDLYPASVSQLQWIGQTNYYAYAKDDAIYKVGAKSGTETMLFDIDMLNKNMHEKDYDSLKRMPQMKFFSNDACWFQYENNYFDYNFNDHKLHWINKVPDSAENLNFEDDTRFIAYTVENNLFIAIDGKVKQITFDQNKGIVYGQTVHRVEFGINKGIFWSPDSKNLAFYRKDETMVTDYPLVDITSRIAEIENTKYPMAGMTSHQVTLGVYNLETGQTYFMKTGEPPDQYLTSVTWDPEGENIYIGLLNREQNHLKMNKYNARNGDFVATIFEEQHPKYVEPEHPLYFLPNKSDHFIWQSERDGWNHLYLYNTKGELINQLTKGSWVVTDFHGLYGNNKLWFTGTKESPIEKNIYSVSIGSDEIVRISPDNGTHNVIINHSGKYILDVYSSTEVSREYILLSNKGKEIRIIKEDKQPLADYNLGAMSIFTLKSDANDDLYCRLIKPIDFDSTQKYPVIVYVYGGPHAQLITDSWLGGAGLFLNYLAQQGYVVFTLDNRGTANRGRDFEQIIHRNLGLHEVEDQLVGVNFLKSLPYVDSTRIGVDGWSYGGFLTISLILDNPGVFKVGVAGGPVTDWKYYEVMYGERYMDTPQENPDGYENSNLLNKVDKLEGKLLIIHGTNDPTVVWQNSLQFLKQAIDNDKDIDYFVYPGHGHNMRGKNRAHLYKKITSFFNDNLK
ncbi:MAG: DPP IV N-terminal domain-containing protein [Bacteroidetes bacterium]|nr:DPP IV N-terminal domain-containing protein [Bacteroidota bacterium]MBL6944706.1 DPP IV N-terminal domain-containing protein [Bacteroidales bacterium]